MSAEPNSTGLLDLHDGAPHVGEVIPVVIAGAAGVAKYLHEMNKNKTPFKILELLAKAFISTFVGYTAYRLALSWGMDKNIQIVVTSLFGWLGADGAELMIIFVKQRFFPPK